MIYYIILTLTVLFWSGNFIFGRMISNDISPIELSFYRWFSVLILLTPYIILNHKRILKAFIKNPFFLLLLGILGIAGFNTFVYLGLQTSPAINALLINSGIPVVIIILSALIFKTLITKIQILGIILSTLGVFYIIIKGSLDILINLKFTSGDLWIVLACFTWALYSTFLKLKPKELNPFDFFSIITLIGTSILYIIFKYLGYNISLNFVENNQVFYSLSYMVIFASILAFYFWNISTIKLGANKTGQFTHLMPIFGSILAYIFLKERLESYHFLGMIFIIFGIYLSMFYKQKT